MALEERDREDLLRDGRNMPVRGECAIDSVTVVVGFRRGQQLSLYCGSDPVFQFNAERQLRRAFVRGIRLAARDGRLEELTRASRGGKVQLVPCELDAAAQSDVLSSATDWLGKLRTQTANQESIWRVIGDDPDTFRDRLVEWIDAATPIRIANLPNA